MQIRPFEELEAMARERYQARYASVPEPIVINVDAVIQYTAPRRFVVGGIGLRAPPLRYPAAIRLLTAANALGDVREAPPQFVDAVREEAIRLIGRSVRPQSFFHRIRGSWLRVFQVMETEELEHFLRFLLSVPDSSPPGPPSSKRSTIDMMDAVQGVMRAWPSCVDPRTGLPKMWAAYIYGARHLARVRAREDLRMTYAFRIAQGADKKDWMAWEADERAAAGWPRG